MIEIKDCTKYFGSICAVGNLTLEIGDHEVFGLVGTNGAGKSTLLRMLAGILKQDSGEIRIDNDLVYDNEQTKSRIFYIPNDAFFPANYTPKDLAEYYRSVYPTFEMSRYKTLLQQFHLDEERKINTFSKGMKKQLMTIMGVASGTKYLFCDETFDGLDPVMRQAVKSLFASELTKRDFTPVIASHNLRELEDICEHVGLLHKGGILLSRDLEDMKFHIHKIQCVLPDKEQEKNLLKELEVLKVQHQGSLLLLTVRGTRTEIMERIRSKNPILCEVIPLTLEEIFISETEVAGYEIQNIFF